MSQLYIRLSTTPASEAWNDKAMLSFDGDTATIHLADEELNLRQVKKAGRQLEALNPRSVKLTGSWHPEQQWAFAMSFSTAKRTEQIGWCDDEHKSTLSERFKAYQFARDLINQTPEECSPQSLAEQVANWLSDLGGASVTVKTCVGEELQKAGWAGIYQVGRGSERPPVLLEVDYNPGGDDNAPVDAALVGKGITFDSGGYSIKSSEGMLTMKCDMGGAATVAGAMGLLVSQKVQKRVRLFLCCAENLISGHAYKLGDVITYKNGVTVEIVNTDAEGRLVLADGLMAASETGAPLIIDAATLTGAAIVALGGDYNAVFSLDEKARDTVMKSAELECEPHWPLPLEPWHQEKCPSAFADTANSRPQKGGGGGGASNAAGFLSRFVANQGQGWVHIDLAAAYNGSADNMYAAGATGHGIRTIARAVIDS
ncbi:aminopeptidase PepB [Aestuariibacter salexigens]|uniref:aminopeptidase PepB n=1 Tax=Aestuariibacter salexigens TaxID=226010 RepID=UPI00047C63A3|nr:aminopeptidase PepB [Aestuariibacter salexigens]